MKGIFGLTVVLIIFISCQNEINKDNTQKIINEVIEKRDTIVAEIIPDKKEEDNIFYLNDTIRAYIDDPTNLSTNVRNNPEGQVILELPKDADYFIYIIAQKNRWFLVHEIHGVESNLDIPGGKGWIHGSVIGFGTRNYGGESLGLFSEPDSLSDLVTTIDHESGVRLVEIKEGWIKVEWEDDYGLWFQGWIRKEWLCGNPLTNCC